MNELISTLLDVARLERGQLSIDCAPMELAALVQRVAGDISSTLRQHTLTAQSPADPIIIASDELRLEQVLRNLIGNAIKYNSQGGAVIVRVEQRGAQAYVDVNDHRIGIPPEALPHRFRRFYRAPTAEAQQISGTRVGCTSSRRLSLGTAATLRCAVKSAKVAHSPLHSLYECDSAITSTSPSTPLTTL